MAEMGRMTAAQAVDKLMGSEHADVIRESVRFMVDALMEAEVSELAGAAFGERAPERRTTQRNGYRPREWDTRVGAIELAIPKLRSGAGYFPSFLEPRRRAEQALVAVVQEAYVNGVSTRKVDRVVEQLGVRMTKDQVSRLCQRLDEQVAAFRERPLEGAYPYLWLDAKQEKVRCRRARRPDQRDRARARMPVAALHSALRSRYAPALPPVAARARLCGAQGGLQR